jgi:hypothetical protein
MALLIRADGRVELLDPANGTHFTLKEIHAAIDTDIVETAQSIEAGTTLLFDEEGKVKHKPVNALATMLYTYGFQDAIVGDVVLCRMEQMFK